MVGSKRRRIIALFIFMQALLFGSTTPIGTYTLQFAFGDSSLGLLGPGWHSTEGELALEQVFALAVALIVGVLIWRGLPFALYCVAALAAISVLFDVIFIAVEFVSFGPLALYFLVVFPLPTVPPALIALPILILSISVIIDERRARPAPKPKALLLESDKP